MTKPELAMLEKVFTAEVKAAFSATGIHLFQTRSKVAKKLAEEGYLRFTETKWGGMTITGYELTHAGRLAYCASV